MKSKTGLLGMLWEQHALKFLRTQKLQLLERNYRCKVGEIDLIMRAADDSLIFVEVRARTQNYFGGAAASVDRYKQQRLLRAAMHYLQRLTEMPVCRFDVIAFENGQLSWYQNAFYLDEIHF